MEEKILCPWCGAEMKRDCRQTDYGEPSREAWFACENCKSNSPIAWGENYDEALKTATEYALRRYTPPIKPMTLEEALERHVVWIEWRHLGRIWDVPIYLHRIWNEWYGAEILSYQMFGEESEYDDIANDDVEEYGITWRCWERKPTDEERRAAEWQK